MLQGVGIADRVAGHSGVEARHALQGHVLHWRPQDALLLLLLLGRRSPAGGLGAGAGLAAAAAAVGVVRRQGLLGLPERSAAAGQRSHRGVARGTGEVLEHAAHRGGDGDPAEMQAGRLGGGGGG